MPPPLFQGQILVKSKKAGPNGISGFLTAGENVDLAAVLGSSEPAHAVGFLASTDPVYNQHVGVYGESDQQGVMGLSAAGTGVYGGPNVKKGSTVIGVRGETHDGVGVQGRSFGTGLAAKFIGDVEVDGSFRRAGTTAFGLLAGDDPVFNLHAGVYGQSDQLGVIGLTTDDAGTGVYGGSVGTSGAKSIGVRGETRDGVGVQGQSFGSGLAAKFLGDIQVDGTIHVGKGGDLLLADFSEDFDVADAADMEPGTVMVLNAEGVLETSRLPYDKKVAGVVSGGGCYRPAIVLDKRPAAENRLPIALVGKVYCKVDAQASPIEVGDLLTTSATPGHAMKAQHPLEAFGAVLGKALRPLPGGCGLIPILIAMQ